VLCNLLLLLFRLRLLLLLLLLLVLLTILDMIVGAAREDSLRDSDVEEERLGVLLSEECYLWAERIFMSLVI
jgi:hypothetical protein